MRGLTTVLRKEVKENFRDRRAIFNSLLLGPILFPLMFVALVWFTTSTEEEREDKTLEVPVAGADNAPSLMRFLEQQGMVVKAAPADPEALVREPRSVLQELGAALGLRPFRFDTSMVNAEPVGQVPSRLMTPDDIAYVESRCARYMASYGYRTRLAQRRVAANP